MRVSMNYTLVVISLALACSTSKDGTTDGESTTETQTSTDAPTTSMIAGSSSGEETADEPDEGTPSGGLCPENSTLTWANFGQKFFTDYCTRCHSTELSGVQRQGAPEDHNFDTLELVQTQIEHIDGQAAAGPNSVNTLMPIGDPTPTAEERQKLGEWLACGTP